MQSAMSLDNEAKCIRLSLEQGRQGWWQNSVASMAAKYDQPRLRMRPNTDVLASDEAKYSPHDLG